MIEHGITTSKATHWVHYFPLEAMAFWYNAALCRGYIFHAKPTYKNGKSLDGSVTGAGWLIPKNAAFVTALTVPPEINQALGSWDNLTGRELGVRGQWVVRLLIERGLIKFPFVITSNVGQREQLESKDGKAIWFGERFWETKTERPRTANLFVQERESGHKVHLVDATTERVSDFPPENAA